MTGQNLPPNGLHDSSRLEQTAKDAVVPPHKPSRETTEMPNDEIHERPAVAKSGAQTGGDPTMESGDPLTLRQKVPNQSEAQTVGAATTKILRGTPEFNALVKNENPAIVFKDEEGTGADRMMTSKLKAKLDALADLVKTEWRGVKLRVTEAWDEDNEHSANSVHYEARGVDITTSDQDGDKLGRLGRLAVDAGFDWVFYENAQHIHASMKK